MTCKHHPKYTARRRPIITSETMPGCVCDRIYGVKHEPLKLARSDRDYWLDVAASRHSVIAMITGHSRFRLIGWSGREFAWLECGSEIARIFPPNHIAWTGCNRG